MGGRLSCRKIKKRYIIYYIYIIIYNIIYYVLVLVCLAVCVPPPEMSESRTVFRLITNNDTIFDLAKKICKVKKVEKSRISPHNKNKTIPLLNTSNTHKTCLEMATNDLCVNIKSQSLMICFACITGKAKV